MLISSAFDEYNAEDRRRRAKAKAMETAKKLNWRVAQFITESAKEFTPKEMAEIKEELFRHVV